MSSSESKFDKVLGMGENISRRDFLDGTLLASGAALLTASAPIAALSQSANWNG
jgi:hypothetical protein